MGVTARVCKDCPPTILAATRRPAPYPGPRCATHDRAERARRKDAAADAQVARRFDMERGEYAKLYALQGGTCAWCQLANGTGKRKLALDHDHATGRPRGLLCADCNQFMGRRMRDSIEAIKRGAEYLRRPPYDRIHFETGDMRESDQGPH